MEKKALVFTREEFQVYIIKQMKEVFPDITVEIVNLFELRAKKANGDALIIKLQQAWNLYEQSGDMNQVFEYLEAIVEIQNHVNEHDGFAFNRDKELLLPAIRNVGMKTTRKEGEEPFNPILSARIIGDLMLTYVLDYEKFTSALSRNQLVENLKQGTPEKTNEELLASKGYRFLKELIHEQAIDNLKEKGWVKPVRKMKAPFGTLYKFIFDKRDYHYQFFIKEWAERYIGPRFLITFPTKYTALVVALKGSTESLKEMALPWISAETLQTLMHEKAYRVSPHVYGYSASEGWTVAKTFSQK